MTALEKEFTQELMKSYEQIEKDKIVKVTRLIQTIEKFGGVKTTKEMIRKGKVSEGFERLQEKGLLKQSIEANVIKSKYAELFTDDEVNYCYELLCEYNYFSCS